MVTLSIRSDGIGFAVMLFLGGVLAAVLVVVDVGSYPLTAVAGGCSTSMTIVWSSLPSVSRNNVADLRRIGSGRDSNEFDAGERYACDGGASAAIAIAAMTFIAVNFMIDTYCIDNDGVRVVL